MGHEALVGEPGKLDGANHWPRVTATGMLAQMETTEG